MPTVDVNRWRASWRRLSRLDRVALAVVVLYGAGWLAGRLGWGAPAGRLGFFPEFLGFLFFISVAYFVIRFLRWARIRVLWSLRNRLMTAYVFIAVVPVLLLLAMAAVASYLVYVQLGAHLLYDDLHDRMGRVAATADVALGLVAAGADGVSWGSEGAPTSSPAILALEETARRDLPGLTLRVRPVSGSENRPPASRREDLAQLVQRGDRLLLEFTARGRSPSGRRVAVNAAVPLTSEFLDMLAPELGPIQVTLTRPVTEARAKSLVIAREGQEYVPGGQIATRRRALGPPRNWIDYQVKGATTLDALRPDLSDAGQVTSPVLISFSERPSRLNQQLFASLGEFREPLVILLAIIGIVFLILEAAALMTGVVLTRTITGTVADLYAATERVKAADFSYRIRIARKDQLGVLAESFNAMTSSISSLLEEQRQKQRLENELSIAREVQAQLFPRALPSLPGIQVAAVCRAARVVSGDYYDFIELGPTRLGMALADISGKGISAALVMASLQAALRSQVLLDGSGTLGTSELVTRLNRHLLVNTSDERYATFFYAVYDSAARTLHYTNAGHVPPFYIVGDQVRKLEEGGTVVGLIDDCTYEQGVLQIQPGSLLVAYSDGLIEPENVYGEEFGSQRLMNEVLRGRDASPDRLTEALLFAAEEWGGSPEQADDMTVLVARMD